MTRPPSYRISRARYRALGGATYPGVFYREENGRRTYWRCL